ncbi:7314_t:CDS:1 [Dentiscutata erythropus]|uniref:7314_t:CDS:1 n=1 Tax=Dentiscutata erythropus TaxID=1348616 RepID=A0A9N9HUU9_9GLOM|nr:7314_t:CDS:1 [Dentiscutata erythropus]
MSDSDTNLDVKKDGSKTQRKSNKEYIEAQLQAYISRLKSDKIPINIGIEQPNSADYKQWSAYIKEVKKFSEEMKRNAEWTFVGILISQTYKIMQILKNKKFRDDDKCKKDLMKILTNSIPDNTSATQAS